MAPLYTPDDLRKMAEALGDRARGDIEVAASRMLTWAAREIERLQERVPSPLEYAAQLKPGPVAEESAAPLKVGHVLSPLELLRREHPDLRSICLVFGGCPDDKPHC